MDLDDLYRLLRGAHVQAQGVIDSLRYPLLVLDENLCIQSANPAYYRTFDAGRDFTLGVKFTDVGDGQWDVAELKLLLDKVIPKSAAVLDYEVTANFPRIGHRTMYISAQRLVHPDDGRRMLLLSIVDGTEKRAVENQKDLLLDEIRHRVKNLLAITQALARQSSVVGRTAAEFRDTFLGRFSAMTRAMDVSIDQSCTDLPGLASAVLAPYVSGRPRIAIAAGPAVHLEAHRSMSVGMVLHELATNAIKYGALSSETGRVDVSWSTEPVTEGLVLQVRWIESGGPAVVPPSETGFGTKLITAAVERDLQGHVQFDYLPGGLSVTFSSPLG